MIEAVVSVSEPTGSETLILAHVGNEPVTVFVRDRMETRYGERLSLAVEPDQLHFFDPSDGKRLEIGPAPNNLRLIA